MCNTGWSCKVAFDNERLFFSHNFVTMRVITLYISKLIKCKLHKTLWLNESCTNHLKSWVHLKNISKFIPTSRETYRPTITKTNRLYMCPRRNGPNFGRVFLMLNYTDITQNIYIQSWTVTEIMAIEKCGLLGCPRTVSGPWRHTHPLRMPDNEKPLANIGMQWPWRDNEQLRPV